MPEIPVKIQIENPKSENIIPMNEMPPWSFGIVINGDKQGSTVMMAPNTSSRQVMILDNPAEDRCWTSPLPTTIMVRLLRLKAMTVKLAEIDGDETHEHQPEPEHNLFASIRPATIYYQRKFLHRRSDEQTLNDSC